MSPLKNKLTGQMFNFSKPVLTLGWYISNGLGQAKCGLGIFTEGPSQYLWNVLFLLKGSPDFGQENAKAVISYNSVAIFFFRPKHSTCKSHCFSKRWLCVYFSRTMCLKGKQLQNYFLGIRWRGDMATRRVFRWKVWESGVPQLWEVGVVKSYRRVIRPRAVTPMCSCFPLEG